MANNDVSYFKRILNDERQQLINQCKKWQNVLSEQVEDKTFPEYAEGEIRTAIGLTELLLDQKLKQFGGLIDDCANKTGENKITCTDLQGFWDMVYFEVEKINKTFKKLGNMEKNNWEEKDDIAVPTMKPKVIKSKVKPAQKSSTATKAHILAARQRLAEAKASALKSKGVDTTVSIVKGKENFISIRPADSSMDENAISSPVVRTTDSERKKRSRGTEPISVQTVSSSKKLPVKNRKTKEVIPLSCLTRSAKRALMERNKASK